MQRIVSDSLKSRENLNYQPEIVIFSKNGGLLFTSFTEAGEEFRVQPAENGYRVCRLEGRDYFVSYATHSAFGMSYAMYLPFDSVARSLRLLRTMTFVAAVLVMLVNTLFCSKLVSQIIQQFNVLVTKMRLFQAGRYEELDRYRSDNRKDEVGYLNRSFDKMAGDVKRLVEENYLTKIAVQEAQLKSLQNQIDPHFLFNILQTINWKAKTGKQEEISHITEALGKILRYTLYKKETLVPLREELEIVEGYVSIQKYRYGERLSVLIEAPKKWGGAMIPPMALQNLAENSIKHALENMLEPCVIRIGAGESGDELLLFVEDNGPGIDEDTLKKLENPAGADEGIGLINIRKRLSLLLGERYTLVDCLKNIVLSLMLVAKAVGVEPINRHNVNSWETIFFIATFSFSWFIHNNSGTVFLFLHLSDCHLRKLVFHSSRTSCHFLHTVRKNILPFYRGRKAGTYSLKKLPEKQKVTTI